AVPEDLPPQVADALAWPLREGVTNILRHANATRVELACRREGTGVELTLSNNGVGPMKRKTDAVGGNGITGLTERVHAVCGQLDTDSPRPDWFSLTVHIPT